MTGAAPEAFDFEKGLQRLEEILALFDQGGLTLEQMEAHFVEGMSLIRKCSERLDGVEARVTQLLNLPDAEWREEPFRPEE
ncbi:MAG: exodeoxyribonuclease VII small subunit [bacterium]